MTDDIRKEGVNQWQSENPTRTDNEGYAGDNDYRLQKLEIESASGGLVDIQLLFSTMQIYEDLFSNTMSCSLSFQDTNNIVALLPIIGQKEKIIATFRVPSEDLEEITFTFQVYRVAVRNISTVGKKQQVTLKGVSAEQFKNIHSRVSKSYYKKIDEMVSEIFNEELKIEGGEGNQHNLTIDVDSSSEKRKYIIPNWHPFDAINWLSDRATPDKKSKACNYLFYQNREGFHLNTIDNLFEVTEPKMEYFYTPRKYRERPGNFRNPGFEMRNIQQLIIQEPGNRLDENIAGMYGSKLLTHDIVRKKYEFTEYSMKDSFKDTNHVPQEDANYPIAIDLDEFSDKPNTFFNFLPIHKTLNQENELHGGDTVEQNEQYAQWLLRRKSLMRQLGSMIINVTVSGDSRRMCGDIVHLRVTPLQPGTKDDEQLDKYLCGNYIVSSIKHNLTQEGYVMDMELSKDNQNKVYPASSNFLGSKDSTEPNTIG